jgi:predicted phage terminase large subunit-like protein
MRSNTSPDTWQSESKKKLLVFARYSWPPFRVAAHHLRIAEALARVERGECRRLIVTMPPRHGKSLLCSEMFPPWFLGRNPGKQIIAATYAQDLADDFGRKVRNLMRDPAYVSVFPGVALREDSTSAKRFHTTQGGVYVAMGVGGPATGRGADCLLIDDPIKGREDAESETSRRKLKDWFTSVAYTRLMPGGAIVVISTRWHCDDLVGWLLREHVHENWEELTLPALDDDGMALWSDRYPVERLQEIKQTIGSRDWSALYQQRPAPAEGGLVKLNWFQRYSEPPGDGFVLYRVQSWDTAVKAQQIHDPSVCTTWAVTHQGFYLLDVHVGRYEFPALKRAAVNLFDRWQPTAVLIEDKASGQSLIQELRTNTRLPVIPIEPVSDKVTRLAAVSALIEAGRVYIPERTPWLIDFESEITTFPYAPHDDQVDSLSQALAWMQNRVGIGKYQPVLRDQKRDPELALTAGFGAHKGAW